MVEGEPMSGCRPPTSGCTLDRCLFQEGYFGRTVNIASRIAEYARPGEVLVTSEVVHEAAEAPGVEFREIGPVEPGIDRCRRAACGPSLELAGSRVLTQTGQSPERFVEHRWSRDGHLASVSVKRRHRTECRALL